MQRGEWHHDRGTKGRRCCSTRLAGKLGAATRLPLAAPSSDRHAPPIRLRRPPTPAAITPCSDRQARLLAPCRGDNILTLSSYNTYAITQYYAMRYNCTRTLLKCNDVNESVRNPRVQVQCDRSSPNIHGNNNKSPPPPTSHPPYASLHIQHRKRLHRPPVSPCLRRAR